MAERPTTQFFCRYFHDGVWWGVQISAYDWTDAAARAAKLGLQLDGEIGAKVPAVAGAGFAVRCWTAMRNLLGAPRK